MGLTPQQAKMIARSLAHNEFRANQNVLHVETPIRQTPLSAVCTALHALCSVRMKRRNLQQHD